MYQVGNISKSNSRNIALVHGLLGNKFSCKTYVQYSFIDLGVLTLLWKFAIDYCSIPYSMGGGEGGGVF